MFISVYEFLHCTFTCPHTNAFACDLSLEYLWHAGQTSDALAQDIAIR